MDGMGWVGWMDGTYVDTTSVDWCTQESRSVGSPVDVRIRWVINRLSVYFMTTTIATAAAALLFYYLLSVRPV